MVQPLYSFSTSQQVYLATSCEIVNDQCQHTYATIPVEATIHIEENSFNSTSQDDTLDVTVSLLVIGYLDKQNGFSRIENHKLQDKTLREIKDFFHIEAKKISLFFCKTCNTFLILKIISHLETK